MASPCTPTWRSINTTVGEAVYPWRDGLLSIYYVLGTQVREYETLVRQELRPEKPSLQRVRPKLQQVLLTPALTLARGDPGWGARVSGCLATSRVQAAGCARKPLSSVVFNHSSSFPPSPGPFCKRAHVLWQAEGAVGCLASHLLPLFIWGGAG